MRRLLSLVMAKHIGQMMTPELATSIAKDLLLVAENPIDLTQFEPVEYKGYVLACERLENNMPELHPLHDAQYAETEIYRVGITMNPDYEQMVDLERAGRMMQFTARVKDTGELVGSMRVFVGECIHTQTKTATLFASDDVFFIKPEHRGGFLAIRLWQYADKCTQQIGVRQNFFDSKLANKAHKLAEYLGYSPIALRHAKVI